MELAKSWDIQSSQIVPLLDQIEIFLACPKLRRLLGRQPFKLLKATSIGKFGWSR